MEVSASEKFGDIIKNKKMVNRIVKLFVFIILSPIFTKLKIQKKLLKNVPF
jgi:hypothetical protein